jgi:hypothetical protein
MTDEILIKELIELPYTDRWKIYNSSYQALGRLVNYYEKKELYGICYFIMHRLITFENLSLLEKLQLFYRDSENKYFGYPYYYQEVNPFK